MDRFNPNDTELELMLRLAVLCRVVDIEENALPTTTLTSMVQTYVEAVQDGSADELHICACKGGLVGEPHAKCICCKSGSGVYRTSKSDKELLEETEQLATEFMELMGYKKEKDMPVYKMTHPRAMLAWAMAVKAQEKLTQSEMHDLIVNCEEEESQKRG